MPAFLPVIQRWFSIGAKAVKNIFKRKKKEKLKANPTAVKSIHLVPLPKASVCYCGEASGLPQIAL